MGWLGPDEKDESGHSEEKTDWLGSPYTQNYDADGKETSISREVTGWLGDKYTQEYAPDGEKLGTTTHEKDFLGNSYDQHYSPDGEKAGTTTNESGLIQDYKSHKDEAGEEQRYSIKKKDLFGRPYVQHHGEYPSAPNDQEQGSRSPDSKEGASESSSEEPSSNFDREWTGPASKTIARGAFFDDELKKFRVIFLPCCAVVGGLTGALVASFFQVNFMSIARLWTIIGILLGGISGLVLGAIAGGPGALIGLVAGVAVAAFMATRIFDPLNSISGTLLAAVVWALSFSLAAWPAARPIFLRRSSGRSEDALQLCVAVGVALSIALTFGDWWATTSLMGKPWGRLGVQTGGLAPTPSKSKHPATNGTSDVTPGSLGASAQLQVVSVEGNWNSLESAGEGITVRTTIRFSQDGKRLSGAVAKSAKRADGQFIEWGRNGIIHGSIQKDNVVWVEDFTGLAAPIPNRECEGQLAPNGATIEASCLSTVPESIDAEFHVTPAQQVRSRVSLGRVSR